MSKLILRIAAGLCLLAAGVVLAAGSAGAATLQQQGWWYKLVQGPTSALPASPPAPSTVPEDGLFVANDPSGAAAISAVRFTAAEAADGTLTLAVTKDSATGTPTLLACPAAGGWSSAQKGAWESRPAFEPASCTVEGQVDTAAGTAVFAIPSSFYGGLGSIDVIIVPGGATPFSIAFDKPTDAAYVSTAPSGGGTGETGSEVPSDSSSDPATEPSASDSSTSFDTGSSSSGSSSSDTGSSSSFSTPSGSGSSDFSVPDAPEVAAGAAPESSGSGTGSVAATGAQDSAAPATASSKEDSTAKRIIAGSVLGVLAIGLFLASGAALPVLTGGAVPASLAARAGEKPRGIGRFSRPRVAPPTGLT